MRHGYWTGVFARGAQSVTATDLNEEVLHIARGKALPADRVTFLRADAFALNTIPGHFDAAFAGFWWSHIPQSRIGEFVVALNARLLPGSGVLIIDNCYVEGSSTPISRIDGEGNTYQARRLDSGETFEVLKNFPTEATLRQAVAQAAIHVEVNFSQYYWALSYTTPYA